MHSESSAILIADSPHLIKVALHMQVSKAPNKRQRKAAQRAAKAEQAGEDRLAGLHTSMAGTTDADTIAGTKGGVTHDNSSDGSKVRLQYLPAILQVHKFLYLSAAIACSSCTDAGQAFACWQELA